MTSRDGVRWDRLREPFLDRTLAPGAWDHAMAWLGGAIPFGDELFLYYGGYARGHKIEPLRERQIGLARMRRDRYATLRAGAESGSLVTPPVVLGASRLTVNAAIRGELRVRILDAAGKPLNGFDSGDTRPVRGDSLAHPVGWRRPLASLKARPVRLEMVIRNADLFALDLA